MTVARRTKLLATSAVVALLLAGGARAEHETDAGDEPPAALEQTPPRLAFVEGEVSFLRPGEEGWTPARPNLALAAGDHLTTGEAANLEIQIGPRAFLRAGSETALELESLESDFFQLRIGSGAAALDLPGLPAGQTIHVDTPNAAITIEGAGTYRVDVAGETTTLTCRRGGSATLTPSYGAAIAVGPSEQVVVSGEEAQRVERREAPALDAWDRWNQERTDQLRDARSARYVSSDLYGVGDLDRYGSWRTVAPYGPIWTPSVVPRGWAPYRFGRWMWHPVFRWTWLDDAPWGWAPCHHGRWVFVHGRWAWAPGPIVRQSIWAPALVAFFGAPHRSWWGAPSIAWVPLGWGEPCVPWWGPRGFLGHPRWFGWGGPRIVNKRVIAPRSTLRVADIRFENASVPGAVVAVPRGEFGRKPVAGIRLADRKPGRLELLRGALPGRAASVSAARAPAEVGRPRVGRPPETARPPERGRERRGLATRTRSTPQIGVAASAAAPPLERAELERGLARRLQTPRPGRDATEPLLVPPGRKGPARRETLSRPRFGSEARAERSAPQPPPRFAPKPPHRLAPDLGMPAGRPRPVERLETPRQISPRVAPRGALRSEPAGRVSRGGRAQRGAVAAPATGQGSVRQPSRSGLGGPRLR